ncbi:MAG: SDR family NAD(P)-dependent oxidoreductase, partial [Bacteroidetes bacterium]|nr:SDR family NAD(P)-dependent oxidoreductase [Fibrella sp.]
MQHFVNQIAFITGAGSGIGRATALAFTKAGARVVVSDINEAGGAETVQQIRELGGDATFITCDVADPAQVEAAVRQTIETYGRLDIGIN